MAGDNHLKIDTIKGESNDSKHKDEIEVESISWGVSNPGSHDHGSGGGSGKCTFQDVQFTAKANKASPQLMQACAEGRHIPKAVVTVRKQGGDQQEYYQVTLSDVIVSGYRSDATDGSGPTDSFSLNFATIAFDYKAQKADGSLDAPVHGGWKCKENCKA